MNRQKMRTCIAAACFLLVSSSVQAKGVPHSLQLRTGVDGVPIEALPALANRPLVEKALAEEAQAPFGRPYVYAHAREVAMSSRTDGAWTTHPDGMRVWRTRIQSTGARNLNLHLDRLELPEGATLWIYDLAGTQVQGPYTGADRNADGGLWTAIVERDEVVVEVNVPADVDADEVALDIASVNHGFRDIFLKQGSCNNDVVCTEGDAYRDQASAVVRISLGGTVLCTGQLVNNTNQDGRPLLLTAYHCILNNAGVPNFGLVSSTVAYFNFESPVCGALSGGQLGQNVSGATFLAGHEPTDFLLAELNQSPPDVFGAYLAGWNASGDTPTGAVGIHHPAGDEKSISFDTDPLTTDTEFFDNTHWRIGDWEDGTTERGSSGSCIFDPADGLCVGTLTGGFAACPESNPPRPEDYYGKISAAFVGGGTPQTRLRDWLDPAGSGVDRLIGRAAGGNTAGGGCVASATTTCLLGGRFAVEADFRDFRGRTGDATVSAQSTTDSGLFYFFNDRNLEILVKMVNGCETTDHFWFFAAATTNVEYTIRVTDTQENVTRSYFNPLGQSAEAITDTRALATCP